ncbi:glycosyltransferase [Bacillus massilinigeriensis]|uniref:glycosyltransferase n=1 Tax=Bacillus mediterraneensis TaxID=1805474 RepID=UPI0008F8D569|nr:glycosyltransferase [Bacillus mediterraneensis]
MNLLVIGRGYPEVETGLIGIFEYEQAEAVSKFYSDSVKIVYAFCDNRSIFRLRRFNSISREDKSIFTYGKYFPIGGFPTSVFNKIKSKLSITVLKKAIKKYGKPDIIHIHFPIITLTEEIWEYLISLKSKIVITEHYTRVQTKELTIQQINLLKKISIQADKFLCVNDILPKVIKELTGVNREFIVVPNVVSSVFTNISEPNKDIYRFIALGRLVKVKKFDLIIEAFSKRFKDNPNIELIIIGDGEEYEPLKKKVSSLKMENKINLTGFLDREKTAKLLGKSNAYISASTVETFGVPVIEAMSCGKPVIIADTSPIKQYINNARGLLFKVNNVDDLADKMEAMYKQRFNYNHRDISDYAELNFSDEAVAKQLYSIYCDA